MPRALIAVLLLVSACGPSAPPSYVGSGSCRSCHAATYDGWRGSHHDLAMQVATDSTVLGDFSDAAFDYFGRSTSFYRDGARFMVRTEAADGVAGDFEIAYTFGAYPLQQLLVRTGRGRLQALGIAWDARPASEGGRRWFHLYPDEPVRSGDPLRWTGLLQNWNTMCAACHSTGLRKGYDPAADSFATSWAEIDVGCEACHGPGSAHVSWAEGVDSAAQPPRGTHAPGEMGLSVTLDPPRVDDWAIDPGTGSARPLDRIPGDPRTDVCAPCHSRRAERADGSAPGSPFAETHRLSLLEEGLYHADGQIDDEVFVYGSFLQSRMAASGVVCADCHDSHSLRVKAPGNALCARCHLPMRFDATSHHGHEPGSPAARCTACHMPARTYMVVDPRLDHSLRVPRPALSARVGAPDPCLGCHEGQSTRWAVEAIRSWGHPPEGPHYGDALAAGRRQWAGADRELAALVADPSTVPIVRATAVELLGRYPGPTALAAITRALADPDLRTRIAAVEALAFADPGTRLELLGPLLDDASRAARAAAGRALADVEPGSLDPALGDALRAAIHAAVEIESSAAERPEAHMNLALLRQTQGRPGEAEAEYRTALRLAPWFSPAWVNLADLYRALGRNADAESLLREGVTRAADAALVRHALGLALVRLGRLDEAIEELCAAARDRPDVVEFSFVFAVALNEAGRADEALEVLACANDRSPGNVRVLQAIATISRDAGRPSDAVRCR